MNVTILGWWTRVNTASSCSSEQTSSSVRPTRGTLGCTSAMVDAFLDHVAGVTVLRAPSPTGFSLIFKSARLIQTPAFHEDERSASDDDCNDGNCDVDDDNDDEDRDDEDRDDDDDDDDGSAKSNDDDDDDDAVDDDNDGGGGGGGDERYADDNRSSLFASKDGREHSPSRPDR
jgi:hypothetical protein